MHDSWKILRNTSKRTERFHDYQNSSIKICFIFVIFPIFDFQVFGQSSFQVVTDFFYFREFSRDPLRDIPQRLKT